MICVTELDSAEAQDSLEHGIGIALSGIIDIWIVQQFLDTQQDLMPSG